MEDSSTNTGAKALAEQIKGYWLARGYNGVRAWVAHSIERVYTTADQWYPQRFYHVRSNIINGFPPREIISRRQQRRQSEEKNDA